MSAVRDRRPDTPAADAADRAPSDRAAGNGVPAGRSVPTVALPTIGIWLAGSTVFVISTISIINAFGRLWVTIPVNAAVIFVMFSVVHDAVHNAIGRKRWVNALFGRLAWILLSPTFSFPSFAYIHLAHHRYANDRPNDPDAFASHAPLWQLPFRWAFVDLYYVTYYIRRIKSRPARELAETATMFGLTVAVFATAAVTGNLWTLTVAFVIPQRIGMVMLAWWFDWLPHHGLDDTPSSNRYRTTRIRVGMEWLFTPLMLSHNYHLVHHLHPRVPWYRYVSTWRASESTYLQWDVPIGTVSGRQLSADQYLEWKRLNRERRRSLPLRMPNTGVYQIPLATADPVRSNDNVCAEGASA